LLSLAEQCRDSGAKITQKIPENARNDTLNQYGHKSNEKVTPMAGWRCEVNNHESKVYPNLNKIKKSTTKRFH
jgi:hypothetical protein